MMKIIALIPLLLSLQSFAQTGNARACTIEIYLLKSVRPNLDPKALGSSAFSADASDLADTSFIKDYEILGYRIIKDSAKWMDTVFFVDRYRLQVLPEAGLRILHSKIPLSEGLQFALTVDGAIAYTGYFWNLFSSFGCAAITATSLGPEIDIQRKLPDYDAPSPNADPRRHPALLDCLIKTNRLRER